MQKSASLIGSVLLVTAIFFTIAVGHVAAQDQTVGLFLNDSAAFDGYTLLAPMYSSTIYLIDMYGREVHSWETSYLPGSAVYLLENSHILKSNTVGGGVRIIQEIDWDGNVIWDYTLTIRQHHDIEPLPNGNILIVAWESFTKEEAIANGRDTLLFDPGVVQLWPDHIVEVEPIYPTGGNIVWEWHTWDHLVQDFDSTKLNYGVVAEHPELVDINYSIVYDDDWMHTNSVDYNPELDQIIISCRRLNQILVFDHSTTTEEAASHTGGNSGMGGDILWRWGHPFGYDAGTEEDQTFWLQHDAQWIAPGLPGEGNILVFNNGGQDRIYSTVDEIETTVDGNGNYPQPDSGVAHGPTSAIWSYNPPVPDQFYASLVSGATRMPNGNTLICSGPQGRLFEVTSGGEIVWDYINPVSASGPATQGDVSDNNRVFRCYRFSAEYPGLQGRDLSPSGPLELYPVSISGASHTPVAPQSNDSVVITALIAADSGLMVADLYVDTGNGYAPQAMLDDGNHHDGLASDSLFGVVLPPISESTIVSYYIYTEDSLSAATYDPANPPATTYSFLVEASYECGDIDHGDNGIDISDLVYLVDYMFTGGPPPQEPKAADMDSSGSIDISDLVYLVDYMFTGGPPPECP